MEIWRFGDWRLEIGDLGFLILDQSPFRPSRIRNPKPKNKKGRLSKGQPTVPTEPVKMRSPAHPGFLRISGLAALTKMAPCLCVRMGRLFDKAQVHPGRSGFEKVGPFCVNKHPCALAQFKARPSRHPPDHVIVQRRAHIHVHITPQRLDDVQCHIQTRLSRRDIFRSSAIWPFRSSRGSVR